ncbi:MAG: alpha/beta hydrolase [Deltaproteobacteria bacterium]|nr:alpha/beta hydrolase [Deltaproteobacteria bacterium]
MKRYRRIILVLIVITLFVLVAGPFLIPIPPLENTVPPGNLADPDSRFIAIRNVDVHYKIEGKGDNVLIFLHGFGASTFTWHKVIKPLSKNYTLIAYDRTGFGYSSRPMPGEWSGESPYSQESQVEQIVALMDALGVDKAVLVGNSAGGVTAALTTLKYPERIKALILVGAAIFKGGPPDWLAPLIRIPQVKRLGHLLIRKYYTNFFEIARKLAWHDPSKQTEEILAGYRKPMRARDWDRALWEFALAYKSSSLKERLNDIKVPVLVITGEDDRIVPPEASEKIADEILHAELAVISNTGHLPHEEAPEEFLEVVNNFLKEVL